MASKAAPLLIEVKDAGAFLFKKGDFLCQDWAVMKLFDCMRLWLCLCGLDLQQYLSQLDLGEGRHWCCRLDLSGLPHIQPRWCWGRLWVYQMLSWGSRFGRKTNIHHERGQTYPFAHVPNALSASHVKELQRSLVGGYMAAFVLGVNDRHQGNYLISVRIPVLVHLSSEHCTVFQRQKFFHVIDFGWIHGCHTFDFRWGSVPVESPHCLITSSIVFFSAKANIIPMPKRVKQAFLQYRYWIRRTTLSNHPLMIYMGLVGTRKAQTPGKHF